MVRTDRVLALGVGVLALLVLLGLVALWPARPPTSPPEQAAPPLLEAEVLTARPIDCPDPDDAFFTVQEPCVAAEVEVTEAPYTGERFSVDTGRDGLPPLAAGDRVLVAETVVPGEDPAGGAAADVTTFYVQDFARTPELAWVVGLFVVATLAVGRWRGLASLVGLGLSLLLVVRFIVPALLEGSPPLLVALVGALAIMLVTLPLSHGLSVVTGAAIAGTAAALLLTAGLGAAVAAAANLTGLSSEEAQFVQASIAGVDLRGLVLAGLVVGALGVLDDVTVTQASTVLALHEADRSAPVGGLFRAAMRVGRDHIAATVNTLVLAYAGASLPLLVLFSTGGGRVTEILNSELVAEEIVKTLVGSIGLIAAVPLTTGLAALLVARTRSGPSRRATRHGHAH